MKLAPLALLASAVAPAVLATATVHADPKCDQDKNKPAATKAVTTALADAKSPLRVAYEAFLTAHDDGVDNRYNELPPDRATAPAWYRKPVENKWLQVIPLGTSRGTEGPDKENSSPTCVDEYLALVSPPVEYKWNGEHLVFAAKVDVINGAKGAKPFITPLQVTPATKP